MGKKLVDLTGQRFGRLMVIGQAPSVITDANVYRTMWHCQCDCGNKAVVGGENLKMGITKSCGCLRRENASRRLKDAYKAVAMLKEMGEMNGEFI
jgi:hypothetical protein